MSRYETMFRRLEERDEGAFVPFLMLGDPDIDESLDVASTMVEAGADALELGLPFSDPVADGPAVQAAAQRSLQAGMTVDRGLQLISRLRERHPTVPIGLLVYANLTMGEGGLGRFYDGVAAAGADSVLVADVPMLEAPPFLEAARSAGVAPVLLVPPNASRERMATAARESEGYVYVVTRDGPTGDEREAGTSGSRHLAQLCEEPGCPPALVGFGVSRPEHVRAALDGGARGAITGSAIARLIAEERGERGGILSAVAEYVRRMKEATR